MGGDMRGRPAALAVKHSPRADIRTHIPGANSCLCLGFDAPATDGQVQALTQTR